MKIPFPIIDYREFRFEKLNSEKFRHLKLLLYWPIYGLLFLFVERFYPASHYHVIYCPLDDLIPFNELFVIPYLFWFIFLCGMVLYLLLYDVDTFKRMMRFIILTYSVAILIYFIFPNCQELRPSNFERDNIFTRFLTRFYQFDTNTNVCPSIHVIGALAVLFAAWNTRQLQTHGWKAAFLITTVLISASTVFLKQHSLLDVFAALVLCLFAYPICYQKADHKKVERKSPLVTRSGG